MEDAKGMDAASPAASEEPVKAYTIEEDGSRLRKLLKPIVGHNGAIDSIRLRKPTYRDIMNMGDPEVLVVMQGGVLPQIDMMQIEKYIVTLSGVDCLLLEQMDYMDALALRDAVRSFFRTAS